MAIQDQIKTNLLDRVKTGQHFDLMNVHKGIPLVYKAEIQTVGDHTARFKVDPPSSICLKWETHTTILEDINTNAISARILNFDIISGIVELGNLQFANRGVGYRMMVRVEPKDVIPVDVTHEGQTIHGELADISLTGFGIRTQTLGDHLLRLRDTVKLDIELLGQRITPIGTLINIKPEQDEYRLAVRFDIELTIPVAVARYITHRRAEIHREIREAYDQAIQSAEKK